MSEQPKNPVEQPAAAPAGYCERAGGCVCGGDLPRVREGCAEWVKTESKVATAPADERAAFEAWYLRDMPHETYLLKRSHRHPDMYDDDSVEDAWTGWQARAASATETGADGAKPVAFVCSASDDFAPIVRSKDAAQKLSNEHGDGQIIPLYAAPQPPAQADALARLLAIQRGFAAQADARKITREQRGVLTRLADILETGNAENGIANDNAEIYAMALRALLKGANHE